MFKLGDKVKFIGDDKIYIVIYRYLDINGQYKYDVTMLTGQARYVAVLGDHLEPA